MARIQRTHHPIFQGSLDTSTFSPIEGPAAHEVGPTAVGPAPQPGPSADATAQVSSHLYDDISSIDGFSMCRIKCCK